MALNIIWSPLALLTYETIILYLQVHWTDREVQNFIDRVDKVITLISIQPEMFKASGRHNIRKAYITENSSFFYAINSTQIEVLYFWDNRQDPKKSIFE